MFKVVNKEIFVWVAIGLLLIGTGVVLKWNFQRNYDFEMLRKMSEDFTTKKKLDSLNILHMREYVDELKVMNEDLKKEIIVAASE